MIHIPSIEIKAKKLSGKSMYPLAKYLNIYSITIGKMPNSIRSEVSISPN